MFSVLLRSGLPKASRMSHYKMMAGGHLLNCVAMTSDDVMYVTLPLYHISALLFGLSNVIRNGKKTEYKALYLNFSRITCGKGFPELILLSLNKILCILYKLQEQFSEKFCGPFILFNVGKTAHT